jgi:hypothetical protein
MFWFSTPKAVLLWIAFIGLLTIAFYLTKLITAIKSKMTTGSWPKNPNEYKYFLLQQENIRLNKKIEALEQENAEILNSIINQIKGH